MFQSIITKDDLVYIYENIQEMQLTLRWYCFKSFSGREKFDK